MKTSPTLATIRLDEPQHRLGALRVQVYTEPEAVAQGAYEGERYRVVVMLPGGDIQDAELPWYSTKHDVLQAIEDSWGRGSDWDLSWIEHKVDAWLNRY